MNARFERWSVTAVALLGMGAMGCDLIDALEDSGAIKGGGTTATEPVKPKPTAPPATVPAGTAGDCSVKTDPATGVVCKICFDAKGTLLSEGCATDGTTPAVSDCTVSKNPSTGEPCKQCRDAAGTITFDGCAGGTEPVKCAGTFDATTGLQCKTCYRADGTVLTNECADVPGPADGGGVPPKCIDVLMDGPPAQYCTICTDAAGVELKRSCVPVTGGTSAPPASPTK